MKQRHKRSVAPITRANKFPRLPKCPTGIQGLDDVTGGGLPRGRPTLVCGGAGCGKTLLAMEFLVRGITQFGEPGVFMAFEEREKDLAANVASLGFDLPRLVARKQLVLDSVQIERSEIEETGEYNLDGLFIRLGQAIDAVGAKRVALDTVESLFAGLNNQMILRAELRRLFRWLKERGVTTVVTGEQGDGALTRHGLEEYVSDCVIVLDHRIVDQLSTRRLRIAKYRGSIHGTNEYPYIIGETGFSVLPITSLGLTHKASAERVSGGIAQLDRMLGGRGYYRGSTILVAGEAGTGKTSLSAAFAVASCRRGERCLYVTFEESEAQILRNMRSIGLNLAPWVAKGLLCLHPTRSGQYGLEQHLVALHSLVRTIKPKAVVLDPITSLLGMGLHSEVKTAIVRLIDHLKQEGITTFLTSLSTAGGPVAQEHAHGIISSFVDTYLVLREMEIPGERNRVLYVLKSRGMAHSNQIREFLITDRGIELRDVYAGQAAVLTGSARLAQEAKDRVEVMARRADIEALQHKILLKRTAVANHSAALQKELAAEEAELEATLRHLQETDAARGQDRRRMESLRRADGARGPHPSNPRETLHAQHKT